MNDVSVFIDNNSLVIEDFKSHLKDRNLIKFKHINSIDEAENNRNFDVYILDKYRSLKNKELFKHSSRKNNKKIELYILDKYIYELPKVLFLDI